MPRNKTPMWAAASLVLAVAATGCGTESAAPSGGSAKADSAAAESAAHRQPDPEKIDSKVLEEDDDHTVIRLADGRQVSLSYTKRGLEERHRADTDADWSAAKTVHATDTAACQGITAKAHQDTVWVTADFGLYCSDGEPPSESVAAVGSGDLSSWDADLTKGMDGWPKAYVYDKGDRVEFVDKRWDGTTTLPWRKGTGFEPKQHVYEPIGKQLVGSWKATDGSQRVTFEQAAPEKRPRLTIETLKGERCLGSGTLGPKSDDSAELNDFKVREGKETTNCPPELFEYFYEAKSADGPLVLWKLGNKPQKVLTYERTD
ncbi:hypothetical protein DSC45_00115 [Streptomyces sp. YIM 130001]|uniref:hypothetical protein n=1 Tax=Streptomyces sp. YIM 130001 TaxID=2259644 RepID=UPI000ED6D815|nr:hypothetical protein [Streptomyces sp. YIM 130001]RII22116.1 hypothetical protein DSC45_00115 [Streptomyces sp. YIM 130001]